MTPAHSVCRLVLIEHQFQRAGEMGCVHIQRLECALEGSAAPFLHSPPPRAQPVAVPSPAGTFSSCWLLFLLPDPSSVGLTPPRAVAFSLMVVNSQRSGRSLCPGTVPGGCCPAALSLIQQLFWVLPHIPAPGCGSLPCLLLILWENISFPEILARAESKEIKS